MRSTLTQSENLRQRAFEAIDLSMVRIIVALAALVTFPGIAVAQDSHAYVGGTVSFVTQTHADDEPLGGTTLGGSALFGMRVSSHVAIECEPSFGGSHSQEYTYRPAPSLIATVVASRRDTVVPVQARLGFGVFEPVFGVGVAHSTLARHATFANGTTYFDDGRSENGLALVAGVDAALRLASHAYLVPTFRMLVVPRASHSGEDPLGEQTSTGWLTFRYGVGARVAF
jgi:hypothetical protein